MKIVWYILHYISTLTLEMGFYEHPKVFRGHKFLIRCHKKKSFNYFYFCFI